MEDLHLSEISNLRKSHLTACTLGLENSQGLLVEEGSWAVAKTLGRGLGGVVFLAGGETVLLDGRAWKHAAQPCAPI